MFEFLSLKAVLVFGRKEQSTNRRVKCCLKTKFNSSGVQSTFSGVWGPDEEGEQPGNCLI